ncbi:MAG: ATP-dependent RecD-like DNA helicase [Candidatus Eisenbacteria bacterium]|nr:ATP-dependent RecD-like DNA helicase [Candidatus Eisenbacteria bacterium]
METPLEGTLERVVFRNPENSWTVARLRDEKEDRIVSVVGRMPDLSAGELLRLTGRWVLHPRFGEQFEVETVEVRPPVTEGGIERYLSSGLVRGIGGEMARRIVERFGEGTLDVIDNEPERLLEVDGIGAKRLDMIRDGWRDQKSVRETLIFLHDLPIGPALAARIYETYRERTVQTVRSDPYLLADEVWGVGFRTADRVAEALGISADSPRRADAGVLYHLGRLHQAGHVCFPRDELVSGTAAFLEADEQHVEEALERLLAAGSLQAEEAEPDRELIYRAEMLHAEESVARRVNTLLSEPGVGPAIDTFQALRWIDAALDTRLGEEQQAAVEAALEGRVTVVTGGPGTGKTTLVRSLLAVLERSGEAALLAAPTGRAAKKMEEATGRPARTIHRLLEFDPRTGRFQRDAENPLSASTVILDEVSMVDLLLMDGLLEAIPPGCRLVLVGDVDQLPSVGPGNVLRDLIESGRVPTVRLTRIYRQARESRIVRNAHRVNRGEMPLMDDEARDFRFVVAEDGARALEWIRSFLGGEAKSGYGFDPIRDVQVLAPMHKGIAGVTNLNREIQELLNPRGEELRRENRVLRVGDKIIQLRNNYDLDVYNGDSGWIESVDPEGQKVEVRFGPRSVIYDFARLDELALAYAVSVHKSQGSEYRAVVVPLLGEHYPMLQRNLLYTALTRGRELVVLVGTKRTVGLAVRNNRIRHRYSLLAERLWRAVLPGGVAS